MADWGWLGTVGKWLGTAAEKAKEYEPLIKTGIAATSTYASFKDQQKKNQMQQAAYDDYMAQAEAAGHAARAAIDVNYTPMVVSGVPTSKADVTDFTAVAARGGLMSVPNRQRKRYYSGTGEEDIEVMDIDVTEPTTSDLEKETGLNLSGEQVKYNTANPRQGAWSVWTSGGINQEIYEFDFEIFFDSGDWMDYLKGEVPATGNMQMASGPGIGDSRNELAIQLFGKELNLLSEEEMGILDDEAQRQMQKFGVANGGIIGLRHGGRPGYAFGPGPVVDQETIAQSITLPDGGEEVVTDSLTDIKDQTAGMGGAIEYLRYYGMNDNEIIEIYLEWQGSGTTNSFHQYVMDNVNPPDNYAQGGRIGYDMGGDVSDRAKLYYKYIQEMKSMGLEPVSVEEFNKMLDAMREKNAKGGRAGYRYGDQVGITSIPRPAMDPRGLRSLPAMATKDGMMDLGGLEKDYRTTGGFVPIGAYEKKDDVPARLSKNEFVMTADAVRAAGGGSINKGAQLMYDTMKHLEAQPTAKRMTA